MKLRFDVYKGQVDCPHCGCLNEGWVVDPRGVKDVECDHCEKKFDVPNDIEVVLE